MEKIILFGTGKIAEYVLDLMKKLRQFEIVEVWDNDKQKHGIKYRNLGEIKKPREQSELNILVASVYFNEIKEGLVKDYRISENLIKPWEYCLYDIKAQIIEKYMLSEDREIQSIIGFLKNEELDVYNYSFRKKYRDLSIKIEYDERKEMFYSFWNGKKMYLSRTYSTRKTAENYVKWLMMEQDVDSPHYYGEKGEYLKEDGVVIDVGAAEGIWALDVLDYVKKVILVESEQGWLEALRYTFEPYRQKVEIIERPLVESENEKGVTLSKLNQKEGRITCIKMDIEGMETKILKSEMPLLRTEEIESLLVCTYHKSNDAQRLQKILSNTGYQTEFSKGYMFYLHGEEILPELRRGIIRARK